MLKTKGVVFFLLIINCICLAQVDTHRWKPLNVSDSTKMWYDASQLDTISSVKFEIWILEMHKPALEFEGIDGKIVRTKTLYVVNLENFTYGISESVYYNINNEEIKRFKYDLNNYQDEYKYSRPIMPNTPLDYIIKEIALLSEKRKQDK